MSANPLSTGDYQNQPLRGWRIVITRAGKQSGSLAQPLRELGAEVIEVPTIEIHPPASYEPLDNALRKIKDYHWLVLTSVNGVAAAFARLKKLQIAATNLSHLKIAAIGPATERAIQSMGLEVTVMPQQYVAESVVDALRDKVSGRRVLLVRAKVARDVLPQQLRKMRALVDIVDAYETKAPARSAELLKQLFSKLPERPHLVTFTSSSTAKNFLELLGTDLQQNLREIYLASIGPVTSATLASAGLTPAVEAREFTMPGLVAAITEFAVTHTIPAQ